jgi:hypothetical protein
MRWLLRMFHVPRHCGQRGHVRQDGGADRRRKRHAGFGVWTHGDESPGMPGQHEQGTEWIGGAAAKNHKELTGQ